jgi:hypothetical protein
MMNVLSPAIEGADEEENLSPWLATLVLIGF